MSYHFVEKYYEKCSHSVLLGNCSYITLFHFAVDRRLDEWVNLEQLDLNSVDTDVYAEVSHHLSINLSNNKKSLSAGCHMLQLLGLLNLINEYFLLKAFSIPLRNIWNSLDWWFFNASTCFPCLICYAVSSFLSSHVEVLSSSANDDCPRWFIYVTSHTYKRRTSKHSPNLFKYLIWCFIGAKYEDTAPEKEDGGKRRGMINWKWGFNQLTF